MITDEAKKSLELISSMVRLVESSELIKKTIGLELMRDILKLKLLILEQKKEAPVKEKIVAFRGDSTKIKREEWVIDFLTKHGMSTIENMLGDGFGASKRTLQRDVKELIKVGRVGAKNIDGGKRIFFAKNQS